MAHVGSTNVSVPLANGDGTFRALFNSRGGKLGLWSNLAPNAFPDNFGGGTVTP